MRGEAVWFLGIARVFCVGLNEDPVQPEFPFRADSARELERGGESFARSLVRVGERPGRRRIRAVLLSSEIEGGAVREAELLRALKKLALRIISHKLYAGGGRVALESDISE